MRLRETVGAMIRRWYIMLLGLLLTAGLSWIVQERVPVTYQATGSQVLMPPSATVGTEGNPYLYLGGMSQALDVLIRHATAVEVVTPVLENFPQTNYSVEADRSTSGSILVVTAQGPTPEETLDVLHAAMDEVPAALKAMQDELAISDKLRINVRTVVVDRQATKDDQSQMRLTILAAGGGIVGTIVLTAMVDGLLIGRSRARHADGEQGARPESGGSEDKDPGLPARGVDAENSGRTLEPELPSLALRPRSRARSGALS